MPTPTCSSTNHGGESRSNRLLGKLRAGKMNMRIKASCGEDQTFSCYHFRANPTYHSLHNMQFLQILSVAGSILKKLMVTPCNTPNFESLKGSWVFLNCNNKLHQYCISIHAHHIQTCSQNSKHNYLCHVCLHTHTLLACNTAELMYHSPTNTTKESKSKIGYPVAFKNR